MSNQQQKCCPYCGETIIKNAKKCKHCKEWLNYCCPICDESIPLNSKICPHCNSKIDFSKPIFGIVSIIGSGLFFMIALGCWGSLYDPSFNGTVEAKIENITALIICATIPICAAVTSFCRKENDNYLAKIAIWITAPTLVIISAICMVN